jgi:CDP-paratose 2-epimerase
LLELVGEIEKLTGYQLQYVRDECRPGDQPVYITDYSKIQRDTGWKPEIGVKQTLRLLSEFWVQNRHNIIDRVATPAAAFAVATELAGRVG